MTETNLLLHAQANTTLGNPSTAVRLAMDGELAKTLASHMRLLKRTGGSQASWPLPTLETVGQHGVQDQTAINGCAVFTDSVFWLSCDWEGETVETETMEYDWLEQTFPEAALSRTDAALEQSLTEIAQLSTAHLTRQDVELLERSVGLTDDLPGLRVTGSEYGLVLYPIKVEGQATEWAARGLSESLIAILNWAISRQLVMIEFDRDNPEIDGVPTHHW